MTPKDKCDAWTLDMFGEDPSIEQIEAESRAIVFSQLRYPIWTEHKARLIAEYLRYFVFITKHGTYIDGFAGPQEPDADGTWAAKLVLETEPRWLRNFFLCELDLKKIGLLKELADLNLQRRKDKKEPDRLVEVFAGDFNTSVHKVLSSGVITEKEAAFALLDQRTFECEWRTVQAIAQHKKVGNKIELFYFLAVKWIHRSLSGVKDEGAARVSAWWGSDDWGVLKGLSQDDLRDILCDRIKAELGYRYVVPWPIYEREESGGAVMYYMIHATDHDQAPKLMYRAYHNAVSPAVPPIQEKLDL